MFQRIVRIFLFLLALAAVPGLAQEKGGATAEPEMSPEEQKAMEAFMKSMTPGPQHRELAGRAGKWTFVGKFWTEPGAPPQESRGTSTREAILGGRVLSETIESEMMGMPFRGLGMTGYDNVTQRYWSTWSDTMSTGLMVSYGSCDDGMTRCEFRGSYSDPLTGKMKETRMTAESAADRETFRSYEQGPDGKEMMTMELVYSRAKG